MMPASYRTAVETRKDLEIAWHRNGGGRPDPPVLAGRRVRPSRGSDSAMPESDTPPVYADRESDTWRVDRKSVVEGKSVDLGGRRIIKKKKNMMGIIAGILVSQRVERLSI